MTRNHPCVLLLRCTALSGNLLRHCEVSRQREMAELSQAVVVVSHVLIQFRLYLCHLPYITSSAMAAFIEETSGKYVDISLTCTANQMYFISNEYSLGFLWRRRHNECFYWTVMPFAADVVKKDVAFVSSHTVIRHHVHAALMVPVLTHAWHFTSNLFMNHTSLPLTRRLNQSLPKKPSLSSQRISLCAQCLIPHPVIFLSSSVSARFTTLALLSLLFCSASCSH